MFLNYIFLKLRTELWKNIMPMEKMNWGLTYFDHFYLCSNCPPPTSKKFHRYMCICLGMPARASLNASVCYACARSETFRAKNWNEDEN